MYPGAPSRCVQATVVFVLLKYTDPPECTENHSLHVADPNAAAGTAAAQTISVETAIVAADALILVDNFTIAP